MQDLMRVLDGFYRLILSSSGRKHEYSAAQADCIYDWPNGFIALLAPQGRQIPGTEAPGLELQFVFGFEAGPSIGLANLACQSTLSAVNVCANSSDNPVNIYAQFGPKSGWQEENQLMTTKA